MVAATVLTIAGFFLLSLLPVTVMSVRRSEHRSQATVLAQNWLERFRLSTFSAYAADSTPVMLPPTTLPDGMELRPEYLVKPVAGTTRAKVFRVNVRWKERGLTLLVFRELTLAAISR